ncbi:hypothetical protein FPRO04_11857 [Fusarium proliferatum]|nr:hypothetical protein FPRO04_11857 [Fusarium proliferatum]
MPAKRMRGTKLLAGMEQENMFTGPDMGSHGTRNQTRLQMNSLEGQTDAGGEENGAVDRGSDSSLSATRSVTPPEHSQTVNRVEDLESPQNVFDTQSIDVLESDDGMSMDMGDGFHLLEDQGQDLTQTINLPGTHQPQQLHVEQLLAEVAALKQQIASLRQHSQQQIALQNSKPAPEPRALPASGSDASELGSLVDTPCVRCISLMANATLSAEASKFKVLCHKQVKGKLEHHFIIHILTAVRPIDTSMPGMRKGQKNMP